MRITNQMMLARSLDSISQGLTDMARLERQIATGQRYQTLSEAPLQGRNVMDIDGSLLAAEQYGRNIEAGRVRLAIEDAALDSLTGILTRAREIALAQAGDTANADTRLATQLEAQALREAVIQLASQRHNNAYVYGGAYADRPPLDPAGALDPLFPARGTPQYEIGSGVLAPGVHDAGEIFIDSDVIGALDALDVALGANDEAGIGAASDRLRVTISNVQDLVTEVGARQVRLDIAEDGHAIVTDGLQAHRSRSMDTSLEEAITLLTARQTAYQASLLATSRVMQSSLVNFLR